LISNIDAIPFYKFAYQILIAQGLGDIAHTLTHTHTHTHNIHTQCMPSELLLKVMSVFFVWPSHTMKIGMSRKVKEKWQEEREREGIDRRWSCSAGT